MTSPSPRPPAAAERLLARVLGAGDWTESVIGDLHEEHLRLARRSRLRAAAWYWALALRLSARGLTHRTRSTRPQYIVPAGPPAPRGDSLMRTLGLETRHALRSIIKRPAMSAIVIGTLALGLGANAAIFSIVDALVLRPFTMRDADRIALISYGRPEDLDRREGFSPADFLDMKKEPGPFERIAAFQWWNANLVGKDEPENVQGFFVSADFFPILGVVPARGRGFVADDEIVGRQKRLVLGYGLWQRRFASDPAIVGRAIEVDGEQFEVIGIAPEGFDFPMGAQIWAALAFDAKTAANRRSQYLTPIAHLAPGRTIDEAKSQMAALGDRLNTDHPETNRGRAMRVYTLAQGMMDIGVGPIVSMWQASAVFVLLIACANVANLLLARGAERQREMAVRLAIGASRGRVVRELLIESGILAVVAVPGALAVAWLSLKLMVSYMPAKIARFVAGWYEMDVDLRLVAFTGALAIVTALVFGLIPALQASRPRLTETLRDGGRGATAGRGRLRLRRGLVIAEIALALPLLVSAALSVLSVHRFLNGPQGFNPDGLLTMQLVLPEARYASPDARRQFAALAVDRLRALPGVTNAAAINVMPASSNNWGRSIEIEGVPNRDPANPPSVDYRVATPSAFETLEIPILNGRGFNDGDREDTQQVAIVSASMARKYWPNADPIGKRFRLGTDPWVTVVGVCGDVIHDWFGRRNYPTTYRPFRQATTNRMALLLRTVQDPTAASSDARAAVRAVDPSQAVFDLQTMRKTLSERTLGLQYLGAIMFVFGGLALLLSVIGVYGVMAYSVTQRTHEIGVRMALGATRSDVLRLTVGQTARLTALGVCAGVGLSLLLGRLIEAGLLGVASSDARVTGALAVVLIGAALAAGYLPARRAASIDPTVALRGE
jgi:putative ABC transport system permease protein